MAVRLSAADEEVGVPLVTLGEATVEPQVEPQPVASKRCCGGCCCCCCASPWSRRRKLFCCCLCIVVLTPLLLVALYLTGHHKLLVDCSPTALLAHLSHATFGRLAQQKTSTWNMPVRSAFNTFTQHVNGSGGNGGGRIGEENSYVPPLWGIRELVGQTDVDGRSIQERILDLQNPVDCSTARILYYPFFGLGHGFGSEVHWMSDALAAALATNRTLVVEKSGWAVFGDKICDGSQFFCYFMPWGKCNADNIGMYGPPLFGIVEPYKPDDDCPMRIVAFWGDLWYSGAILPIAKEPMVGYRHRTNQWWRGQLLAYLLRPTKYSVDTTVEQWNAMGLNAGQRFIAMHVRHGEKAIEAPQGLFGLERYMKTLEEKELCPPCPGGSNCPRCDVFVSSEDPDVINGTRAYPQVTWHWTDNPRQNSDAWAHTGTTNAEVQALIAVWNLYIAIAADDFIGTYSSNWSRLVYELMLAIKGDNGVEQTFRSYSLDMEWIIAP